MADETEFPLKAPSFFPATGEPLTGQDALVALENALDVFPTATDLVISTGPPTPVGRSWQFDFAAGGFVKGNARTPQETRGQTTLAGWIEKCLRTARGAHPVHPPGYGMVQTTNDLIGMEVGIVPADLEQRVRDALTFHPRISDVRDFGYDFDPDENWLAINCAVVLDNDERLDVMGLTIAL